MHPEAYENCRRFVEKYGHRSVDETSVIDIGAQAIGKELPNCLRPLFPAPDYRYMGLDLNTGPNVDMVIKPYDFPIMNETIDIVLSTSCFEHVPHFWVLFSEMVRVLKIGGIMWLDVPSAGPPHWGPDYWRFLPDCWSALQDWDGRVECVERYIGGSETWMDNVGIFRRFK